MSLTLLMNKTELVANPWTLSPCGEVVAAAVRRTPPWCVPILSSAPSVSSFQLSAVARRRRLDGITLLAAPITAAVTRLPWPPPSITVPRNSRREQRGLGRGAASRPPPPFPHDVSQSASVQTPPRTHPVTAVRMEWTRCGGGTWRRPPMGRSLATGFVRVSIVKRTTREGRTGATAQASSTRLDADPPLRPAPTPHQSLRPSLSGTFSVGAFRTGNRVDACSL